MFPACPGERETACLVASSRLRAFNHRRCRVPGMDEARTGTRGKFTVKPPAVVLT